MLHRLGPVLASECDCWLLSCHRWLGPADLLPLVYLRQAAALCKAQRWRRCRCRRLLLLLAALVALATAAPRPATALFCLPLWQLCCPPVELHHIWAPTQPPQRAA